MSGKIWYKIISTLLNFFFVDCGYIAHALPDIFCHTQNLYATKKVLEGVCVTGAAWPWRVWAADLVSLGVQSRMSLGGGFVGVGTLQQGLLIFFRHAQKIYIY